MSFIDQLQEIVGSNGLLLGEEVSARPNASKGRGSCPAKAIVRPANTEELSAVMKLCHANDQPVVTHGGLTGTVDGITCAEGDVVVSLERMRSIQRVDAEAGVMVVEAGVVLENAQAAAKEAGWQLAVDFGARGSAQIGGMISTNAGGNSVVRYGMTREQVLGLEVVLADGTVISSMNEMLKNNTGYDLKHWFIGAEGTLGIVTRAVLRLRPQPKSVQTAFVALDSYDKVVTLLRRLGSDFEGKLSAYEVMWNNHYRLMVETLDKHQAFLPVDYPYYVLLEQESGHESKGEEHFMEVLSAVMEEELVTDAVIAQTSQQAAQLWEMRDDVGSIARHFKPLAAFDISMPLSEMEAYVERVTDTMADKLPEVGLVAFGHLGDGNLHILAGPAHEHRAIEEVVYGELVKIGGAVSAEHGIGLEKKDFLSYSRSEQEIALMKTIKQSLDPKQLLNPGKIFS
ncbi:FAD-binding oxidoreductase [Maricurvus nonylphenolicus]|uniref:FAD-binding oxidoreductase n=1 Tax=Maricurvus nonylphenolicus TaxID=1008307 RepID=UPI0036F1A58A